MSNCAALARGAPGPVEISSGTPAAGLSVVRIGEDFLVRMPGRAGGVLKETVTLVAELSSECPSERPPAA